MSYIIPQSELSLTDMKKYKTDATSALLARAKDLRISVTTEKELNLRGWLNIVDGGTPLEQWNTAALAVVGTPYSVFQNQATVTLNPMRLAVFYKVAVETVPPNVSRLEFRQRAVAGNMIAEFDLEQLYTQQELVGWFSEPVVINPSQLFACQVICRFVTGLLERVQLGALVAEPAGTVIA